MELTHIDGGAAFDFGRTSEDYALYRDIYPASLFDGLRAAGIGLQGQRILDLGTGTGAFPRGLYGGGAEFTGVDISPEQIREAGRMARAGGMDIRFLAGAAEDVDFPPGSFDVVSAVQCFLYFDKDAVLPKIHRLLAEDGLFLTVWMAWLPGESEIARETEALVLKYNPRWRGGGYAGQEAGDVPAWAAPLFSVRDAYAWTENVPFSRESWMGRIRACRGVAAALDADATAAFDAEHGRMLDGLSGDVFAVPHQILVRIFRKNPA